MLSSPAQPNFVTEIRAAAALQSSPAQLRRQYSPRFTKIRAAATPGCYCTSVQPSFVAKIRAAAAALLSSPAQLRRQDS
jgi:hypothetical protein